MSVAPFAPTPGSGPPAWGSAPAPGRPLAGRYLVTGELGRGGVGVVFRARDTALQRDVAVEMLGRGGLITDRQLRRLEREDAIADHEAHPRLEPTSPIARNVAVKKARLEAPR